MAVIINTVSQSLRKITSWTTVGKDNYQASTDYLKLYTDAVIESETWTTSVQLKSAA